MGYEDPNIFSKVDHDKRLADSGNMVALLFSDHRLKPLFLKIQL